MAEIFRQERAPAGLHEPATARVIRLHRYYYARALAAGRDVLDLAGGDGAGPALLAQRARQVRAQVAAPEAAAACFPRPNLAFLAEPDDHGSADLVLAFGLLARAPDPAALLARLHRMVRQGGLLLLDATADDPRHVFTRADLADLLHARFAHARLFDQIGLIGSVLRAGAQPETVFRHPDPVRVEAASAIATPDAILIAAADTSLDHLPDSLFAESGLDALARAESDLREARAALALLQQDHAALQARTTRQTQDDSQSRHALAALRVSQAAAVSRAAALEAERDRALAAVLDRLEQPQPEPPPPPPPIAPTPRPRLRWPNWRARVAPALRARATALRADPLFDPAWYLSRYPDIAAAGLDPALHYLRDGGRERRDPGPGFNTAWYLDQHPQAATPPRTPLEHHAATGRPAGLPTTPPEPPAAPPPPPNPDILFVAGEPDTPGAIYRCIRHAAATRAAGWNAGWNRIDTTGARELIGVRVLILWRVRWSEHVEGIMREARINRATVVFDLDDLMIRPELATTRVIDGIRTTNAGLASTRETFAATQRAMAAADLCTTTTQELADHMRAWQKPVHVLPNSYDAATLARSRHAVRRRAQTPPDGRLRIGYAAGTVTHQRDFAVALPALLRVLATRDNVLLVLFRASNGPELVAVEEFESLAPHADRIEWRDKVDLADLPDELARFDINLAPLEVGNPFCEAKSELKIFEAALVSVPTIASPTGPFQRCIDHGRTGLLAATNDAWHDAMLRLIDDPDYRAALGRAAWLACLHPFGPHATTRRIDSLLRQIGGGAEAARAFALDLATRSPRPITLTPTETLHATDHLQTAEVTVIVPCFNYADTIIEALESVRAQTLAPLDLIVIDDASSDPLATDLVTEWARVHATRFNRLLVLRHHANAGLSAARNTGFEAAETPYVLPLDADNRLRPQACESLLNLLRDTQAAYAYGQVQMFGAADSLFCNEPYRPARFTGGNYIDAMALITKSAWAQAGGYHMPRPMGWEDFDLWCILAELGEYGLYLDQTIADYRVHANSMVAREVEVDTTKQHTVALMELRHPWLRLSSRTPHERI